MSIFVELEILVVWNKCVYEIVVIYEVGEGY